MAVEGAISSCLCLITCSRVLGKCSNFRRRPLPQNGGKIFSTGCFRGGKNFFCRIFAFRASEQGSDFLSLACYYAQKCIETSVQPAGKHGQKVPMCGLQEKTLTAENATLSWGGKRVRIHSVKVWRCRQVRQVGSNLFPICQIIFVIILFVKR